MANKKGNNQKSERVRVVIGVIGIIISIISLFASIPLAFSATPNYFWLILTGFIVAVGIILIAWAFGD